MRTTLFAVALSAAASGCALGPAPSSRPRADVDSFFREGTQLSPRTQEPAPSARGDSTPYGDTRARLQVFREELAFDELDVDRDGAPGFDVTDAERERLGFRGEFGSGPVGGFFQVFTEDYRAPSLLGETFDLVGAGGGVAGTPDVGQVGPAELVVPLRFTANIAGGSETVNGFDADFAYFESEFEVGFGARAFGVQASSGVVVNSLGALYESDDPARFADDDPAVVTGTNLGVYFEGLYKHERVPLMARARVVLGDVDGFLLTFGFAF